MDLRKNDPKLSDLDRVWIALTLGESVEYQGTIIMPEVIKLNRPMPFSWSEPDVKDLTLKDLKIK